jgi:hypothetical protein
MTKDSMLARIREKRAARKVLAAAVNVMAGMEAQVTGMSS